MSDSKKYVHLQHLRTWLAYAIVAKQDLFASQEDELGTVLDATVPAEEKVTWLLQIVPKYSGILHAFSFVSIHVGWCCATFLRIARV